MAMNSGNHRNAAESDPVSARKRQFILLVDDDPRDTYYAAMLLQNFGYNVTTVRNGEEALAFLAVAVPALIVMELRLPGMSGFDLLERLRRHRSSIPVLIQTRLEDLESEDHCQSAGCTAYLRKPVSADDLFRAVQGALEKTPRENIRIQTDLRVSIDGAGTGSEFITMLSDTGCFVKTLNQRPVGSRHTLSFILAKHIIRTEAEVLYAYAFGEGPNKTPGMGMKFLSLGAEDRLLVQRHIRDIVTPGDLRK